MRVHSSWEVRVVVFNGLAQDVEGALSGLLGGFIAHVAVKKCCERMGVSPDALEDRQLEELAERIESFVNAGLGREEAELVSRRIRSLVPA